MITPTCWILLLQTVLLSTSPPSPSSRGPEPAVDTRRTKPTSSFDYDVIVVGGGASGMMAAGTSAGFGARVLLVDDRPGRAALGGDCTNAACVPSKASRAVGRTSVPDRVRVAREHVAAVVGRVRDREDVERVEETTSGLDVRFVRECRFASPHELVLVENVDDETETETVVSSRRFVVATGAGPVVPTALAEAARSAGLPTFDYRTVLDPDKNDLFWETLSSDSGRVVVVAGGGPTACELAQTIARLGANVTVVAPALLPEEDPIARRAAAEILEGTPGVELRLGRRVVDVEKRSSDFGRPDAAVVVADDGSRVADDCAALLLAVGRSPADGLSRLDLDRAGVAWSPDGGVEVDRSSLRSVSAPRVYACGDCASAVSSRDRRASHAGWTGFHVARNVLAPRVLRWGRDDAGSVHPHVPRVVFTDPEIASVGASFADCVREFGGDGFRRVRVSLDGADRADADRVLGNEYAGGVLELRVRRLDDRVLGATVVSPAAAETINEVALALVVRATCRDLARTLHAYPSHGYPLQRAALSMTLSDTLGLLWACGPVGRALAAVGRTVRKCVSFLRRRRPRRALREWQAEGVDRTITTTTGRWDGYSFLEASKDEEFCAAARERAGENDKGTACVGHVDNDDDVGGFSEFVSWLDNKPSRW